MAEMSELVSIIIPLYNAEKYIRETLHSIERQTYENWEIIIVDDCSSDNSVEIIKKSKIENLELIQLENNSGPAVARNAGIKIARGRYITFLDADDYWREDKLAMQVAFMKKNNYVFSYTGYEFTDENGVPNGKKVHVPAKMTYAQALKNTTISTITVMFDTQKLSKEQLFMPLNNKREDTATWWNILKQGVNAYGIDEILSYYRRHSESSSANKVKAVKETWKLYRMNEKFGFIKSLYYFTFYILNAIRRRL